MVPLDMYPHTKQQSITTTASALPPRNLRFCASKTNEFRDGQTRRWRAKDNKKTITQFEQ